MSTTSPTFNDRICASVNVGVSVLALTLVLSVVYVVMSFLTSPPPGVLLLVVPRPTELMAPAMTTSDAAASVCRLTCPSPPPPAPSVLTADPLVRARAQAHPVEHRGDTHRRVAAAGGCVDLEVLPPGQERVEPRLLDDRADAGERLRAAARNLVPEHRHRSRRWPGEPEQQPDDRRLTCAVGADKAKRDTARNLEVDAIEGLAFAELLGQPGGLDGRRNAVSP